MIKIVDTHIKKKLQGGCINVICMPLTKVVACTYIFELFSYLHSLPISLHDTLCLLGFIVV